MFHHVAGSLTPLLTLFCPNPKLSTHKLFYHARRNVHGAPHAQPHSNSAKQRIESSNTVSRTRVKALQEAPWTRHDLSGCCWVVQHTFSTPLPSPSSFFPPPPSIPPLSTRAVCLFCQSRRLCCIHYKTLFTTSDLGGLPFFFFLSVFQNSQDMMVTGHWFVSDKKKKVNQINDVIDKIYIYPLHCCCLVFILWFLCDIECKQALKLMMVWSCGSAFT